MEANAICAGEAWLSLMKEVDVHECETATDFNELCESMRHMKCLAIALPVHAPLVYRQ